MLSLALPAALACGWRSDLPESAEAPIPPLTLYGVAQLFSELPLSPDQVREVRDAVVSSMEHGYDSEYMMCDLFTSPGSGVGSDRKETRAQPYAYPLRDLIRDRLSERVRTRADNPQAAEASVFFTVFTSKFIF